MITVEQLIARCENLSAASNRTLSTISGHLFGDGTRLAALKAGKDMGARRIESCLPKLIALEEQCAQAKAAAAEKVAGQ